MDPETTLGTIRELVASMLAQGAQVVGSHAAKGHALAEQVEALDNWLSKGGELPADWRGAGVEDHR
jgi:hypothetical protein